MNKIKKPKFTKQQLKNWLAFEKAFKSGRYHTVDPEVGLKISVKSMQSACGLVDHNDFMFTIKNYAELKTAVENAILIAIHDNEDIATKLLTTILNGK